MKKAYIFLLILLPFLTMVSCKKDQPKKNDPPKEEPKPPPTPEIINPVVGKWKVTKVYLTVYEDGRLVYDKTDNTPYWESIWEFSKDGKGQIAESGTVQQKFSFTNNDKQIDMTDFYLLVQEKYTPIEGQVKLEIVNLIENILTVDYNKNEEYGPGKIRSSTERTVFIKVD